MPPIRACIPLIVWPVAFGALALALTYNSGRPIWQPLIIDAAEAGLFIGLIHIAFVQRLRRARRAGAYRPPSRPAV